MNPDHIWNWTRVIFAIVCLTVVVAVYRDYHSAPVTWRAGQVLDKEWKRNRDTTDYYYIRVKVGGDTGKVSVDRWEYQKWQVGQACEVSFRQGRIINYNYGEIRPPGSETGGRGRWWEGKRDWW